MGYKDYLQKTLGELGIITGSFTIKKIAGSSVAEVFQINGRIFKVGPIEEAKRELANYSKFQAALISYSEVFPKVELIAEDDKLAVWEVEFIGRKNLEDALLQFDGSKEQLDLLSQINHEVLRKIRLLFFESIVNGKDSQMPRQAFFEELLKALQVNLKKAGLDDMDKKLLLEKIQEHSGQFTQGLVVSIAHKDLTVGNIIIVDKSQSVKFIDPRQSLPYLEESTAIGNAAVDLVGYYISVWRKEMELQKKNKDLSLSVLKHAVGKELAKYQQDRIYNSALADFCSLYWYSVYLACKCEYCTAPDRIWLYEAMQRELENIAKKILTKLS